MTVTTDRTVVLNPAYGWLYADGQAHHTYEANENGGVPGQIVAAQVPGGFWAVKVRQRGDQWTVFAVPRRGTIADPCTIATSPHREAALSAGIGWADSASVAVLRLDRIVFAGFGDATEETPLTEVAVSGRT